VNFVGRDNRANSVTPRYGLNGNSKTKKERKFPNDTTVQAGPGGFHRKEERVIEGTWADFRETGEVEKMSKNKPASRKTRFRG